jgi:hypothetical protein
MIVKARIAELKAACRAALDWYGPDGDHIGDPARSQLLQALGLPTDYTGPYLPELVDKLSAENAVLRSQIQAARRGETVQWVDFPQGPGIYWYLEPDADPTVCVVEDYGDTLHVLRPGTDWDLVLEDCRNLAILWALITPPRVDATAWIRNIP